MLIYLVFSDFYILITRFSAALFWIQQFI